MARPTGLWNYVLLHALTSLAVKIKAFVHWKVIGYTGMHNWQVRRAMLNSVGEHIGVSCCPAAKVAESRQADLP